MKKSTIAIAVLALAVTSWSAFKTDNPTAVNTGIDIGNMDKTVKPTDDFFSFVNGNWIKNNPIPASESSWGSFRELHEKNAHRLSAILKEVAADKAAKQGSNTQKIRDFYTMVMDSVKLNKERATPLQTEFDAIAKISNTAGIIKEVAHLNTIGIPALFFMYVDQDPKISTEYITQFYQGGIGLPDRDYYTNTDDRTLDIQKAYLEHIEAVFKLLGDKPEVAKQNAQTVVDLETSLAKASMTQIEQRDIQAQYNKYTIAKFNSDYPELNITTFLDGVSIKNINEIIVGQPLFFQTVNDKLKNENLDKWKTYLRWTVINHSANKLSDDFVNQNFKFYGNKLMGTPSLKPRWKRAIEATDHSLGDALGQLFVKKYFTEESKKRVNVMVDNLVAAYRERIHTRDWMSDETKKQANLKLDKVIRKLGYPDKWKDYSTLDIKTDSYIANVWRANYYSFKEMIDRLGKPIDKATWLMTAPTINAYYNPTINEIVFPAGIMQPVFFNADADDAVNYGSMGAVIGHELTHGFDDQGAQFDADGNLKNWWTEQDLEKFKAKTNILVKQFDNYVAIDDIHVKGALTLGENIADLGGLTIAYHALKRSMEGKPAPAKIEGYTAEQRFFIAWAQSWRVNMRPEFLKNMVQTNPHSPGNFRANGPPSNMQEFYDAFNVKPGDKMYRPKEERAEIW